jgi:hypothetical protein
MENEKLNVLFVKMVEYFVGDAKRIQHFVKVHAFAKLIGECEKLPPRQLFILEAAAYVHDIGIKPAEKLWGRSDGKAQELLGPEEATKILKECNFSAEQIERITYLVGHHHTYTNIDDADYRILVEADFLVNFYEDACDKKTIEQTLSKIFVTPTSISLCKSMYNL